uniref:proline racemase family protein n=1 Tax=Mariniblastus fucicola TaxID=980251 RepID=UPI0036F348FA
MIVQVIDSHTEGEPTRVIIEGGPDLGTGPLSDRVARFRENADEYRQFAINEPRAFDAVVGALICKPEDPDCAAGVIFFNNAGYLGMCGHGTIGLAVTLHHLGRIGLGTHQIETPVGVVTVDLISPNRATIENVPSYRHKSNVMVEVENIGMISGEIAWGGNWFFLVHPSPLPLETDNIEALVYLSKKIMESLAQQGHTGSDGAAIDHVEFSEDVVSPNVDCRNFVLCPGGVYDRSPCGTGTSAKLACLAEDGKLEPGATFVQESIGGGQFTAEYWKAESVGEPAMIIARITGNAFIIGETKLIGQPGDPLAQGIVTESSSPA